MERELRFKIVTSKDGKRCSTRCPYFPTYMAKMYPGIEQWCGLRELWGDSDSIISCNKARCRCCRINTEGGV